MDRRHVVLGSLTAFATAALVREARAAAPSDRRHLASAHMVVEEKVRIRTFDRLGDEPGRQLIRRTGDHVAEVGQAAAMTRYTPAL